MSALLGQKSENPDANPKKSKDEEDLQERSTKKMKRGSGDGKMVQTPTMEEAGEKSYRDSVLGRSGGSGNEEDQQADGIGEEDGEWGDDVKVEERTIGNYTCPVTTRFS
ncbi:hypothetical protein A2U01_0053098 [Trifolium medium]|uniref:Uncharacterized protein n=1 Tax=Trifolium medium TaxID=97028 RepID=A0A392R7P8_9FABA|nr:hypothetical protein [Trifolium medium]